MRRGRRILAENLAIELNVISAAQRIRVQKLRFLGSSCIYPRLAPQPIPETALLTGELEPTNEWYAVGEDRRHVRQTYSWYLEAQETAPLVS